jgi:diguanylate cyclase (GGDEF)-like protein
MDERSERIEQIGPQARLQDEIFKLESRNRDALILAIFGAAVLLLGILSLITPDSFWRHNTLEIRFPPQALFVFMMMVMVLAFYMVRREAEVRKLRLLNLQQAMASQSDRSASMIDSLTNVFSRSFLRELLQGEISRAERNDRPLGLIMCDVDQFKAVNDRFGHLMGDFVLAQIASILKGCVRGSDYVVRYGGDEFLVVLAETNEVGSQVVMNRIRQRVREWDKANRIGDIAIGVSLGLHQHVPGQSVEQSVAVADARMYADKQAAHEKDGLAAPPQT